jgi:multiple sugar transport system permease protein
VPEAGSLEAGARTGRLGAARLPLPRGTGWQGLLFVLPALAALLLLLGYPTVAAVAGSFLAPRGGAFTLANYEYAFSDPLFWLVVKTHWLFVGLTVLVHVLLGFAVALLLNLPLPGITIFRIVAILPWTISDVIAGIMWRYMYDPLYGIVNDAFFRLGLIRQPITWLGEPSLALLSVVVSDVWRGFPFVMLILLAGLQTIPQELYEAAAIDGADAWRRFRHITIPGVTPMLIVAVALDLVWQSRRFGLIEAMTQGGPGNLTEILSTFVYRQYFRHFDYGYAAAAAVLLALMLLAITLPYVRMLTKERTA